MRMHYKCMQNYKLLTKRMSFLNIFYIMLLEYSTFFTQKNLFCALFAKMADRLCVVARSLMFSTLFFDVGEGNILKSNKFVNQSIHP